MFNLSPLASRANWVFQNIPWQEVGQFTLENQDFDGRRVQIQGSDAVHFGNVSYIGLDVDERLKQAACEASSRYGVQFSSSRSYLQLPLYEELESLLGQIFGRPCLAAPSTTLGHFAAMPVFICPKDVVLVDYLAHASLQMVLEIVKSRGTAVELAPHNDMDWLEKRISELTEQNRQVWYVADGVYSMYGDFAPFGVLNQFLERFENLNVYLDDAHGMSWTGRNGSGTVVENMWPLHERMVLVSSMAKGFGSTGGIIVCPNEMAKIWLRRAGASLIFSGPLQAGSLGAAIESAKIHLSPEIEARQQRLKSNIRHFLEKAQEYNVFLADRSESPIFFAGVGKMATGAAICKALREAGFYTNLGIFPAVALNQTGLRISIHYHLEKTDIDHLLRLFAELLPMHLAKANTSQEQMELAFRKRPDHAVFNSNTVETLAG